MMRRGFLGGVAGMVFGGNPPMRPDQAAAQVRSKPGSGPAPQSAFIVAQRVIVFGTGAARGVFVYSGTPATGNLVGSMTAVAGNDGLPGGGNAYLAGITSYNPATIIAVNMHMTASTGFQFYFASSVSGPWTQGPTLNMLGGAQFQMSQGGLLSANPLLHLQGGDLSVDSVGNGLRIAEGSNAKMGTATLAAGTATVSTTAVTANSRISLTAQTTSANSGALGVFSRAAGSQFVVHSTNAADANTFMWLLVEPA